jgi:outer membrane protein OmpA-like peptidoglycan-associated protein
MADDEDRDAILLRRTRLIAAALAGMLVPSCAPAVERSPPTAIRTGGPQAPMPRPPSDDRDADGVKDEADRCPDAPEDRDTVHDGDGCPEDDGDADLIPDFDDACPLAPGDLAVRPEHRGCPMPCLTINLDPVIQQRQEFAPGSAVVPRVSKPLDDLVQILNAQPEMKIEIAGHTSRSENNPGLALARARAVHAYLVKKGVAADRMTPKGFGDTRPTHDETTASGRAHNRRVDFHLLEWSPLPAPVPPP